MTVGDRVRFVWRGDSIVGEIASIGIAHYVVRVAGVFGGQLRVCRVVVRFGEVTLEVAS